MSEIVESFHKLYRDTPDRPLIFLPGPPDAITTSRVWEQQQHYSHQLRALGVREGDLVVSGTGNRPDLIALLLACRSLDAALMAADTGATRIEIVQLGARFRAAALVLSPASIDHTRERAPLEMIACERDRETYPHAALLKLTSGSTDVPRATYTTEPQLVADARQIAASTAIGPADTQIAAIPLAHSYGMATLVVPLLLQGTPLILRESFVPQQLAADAQQFDARRFPGVPFMFEYLLDHPPAETWPVRLDRLVSAGAPLAAGVIRAFHRRFGVKLHAFYGTTETGGITYDESDDPAIAETVGRPLDGVTLELHPEIDLPGGRVHVRSRAVSDGYANAARGDFTDHGFLTGDYGTLDADGRLTLCGRVSSFINVAGRKVQPAEVEATLRELPGVADVRVIGGTDDRRGEHVVACIVLRAGSDPVTALTVRQFCADRLAPHKIPREVVFLDAIPLTSRGKTNREALEVRRSELKKGS